MDSVTIIRGQGGLGRQPLGQDFISGLTLYGKIPSANYLAWSPVHYYFIGNKVSNGGLYWVSTSNFNFNNTPSLSSAFWVQYIPSFPSGGIAKFGGVQDALNADIIPTANGNYSDETPAMGSILVTTVGAAGDLLNVYFQEKFFKVLLCAYTLSNADHADATGDTLAASLVNAINLNSANTGYLAIIDATLNQVGIYARPGLGIYPNTKSVTIQTLSATFASTITAFSGGVASILTTWWYHINRFFTQSPNSILYVGLFDQTVGAGYLFPEIVTMQTFAQGSIRQMGVYFTSAWVSQVQMNGYITALQNQVKKLIAAQSPLSVIIGTDISTIGGGVASLTDLSNLNSEHVSISAGQDGGAIGAGIFAAQGVSVTQVGDLLGMVSLSQVSDDIGWVATYTLSPDGVENAIPAFATGELLSNITSGIINAVDAYRYIFGNIAPNNSPSGTYVNDSHCCTAYSSDYAYIENNRTFDKASRQSFAAYYIQLKAPLVVNPDGTLTNGQVAYWQGIGEQALANMAANNPNTGRAELSGFNVVVNPNQNVLATSTLIIAISIQPVGVARNIVINLSFTVSVSA